MEAKFVVRRLVASIILAPVVALAYVGLWFYLVMLGAVGSLGMALNALPSVLVVWILFATLYPAIERIAELVSRP